MPRGRPMSKKPTNLVLRMEAVSVPSVSEFESHQCRSTRVLIIVGAVSTALVR